MQVITTPNSYDLLLCEIEVTVRRIINLYSKQNVVRLGQLYMNMALPTYTWPELFYEEDDYKCEAMIRQQMTELQNPHFVNRMIDIQERTPDGWLNQLLSGKYLSPVKGTTEGQSTQGFTGSGTNVSKLSAVGSRFLARLKGNGSPHTGPQ